ncbi:hypothetical protein PVAND_004167 [Polypedilum vanderplanki]|uniref:DUF4371 domain-containing protein n=1 Tax=Polypedilum vanderplanki TaxID=319348 RepID=A0A9J6BWW0_POLVA|nr:hypothetical protein PVAND_004167 [Polypedilum vanderplanki]
MIKGSVWHLKDHLSSIHKDIAHNLGIHARDRSQKRTQAAQVVIPDEFFPKKQKITLDLNKTIRGIIRLFLRKNYALSGADDWPKELHTLKQEFDAYNKTLNRRNLRKYIMQAAEQIYQLIANDLKGKLPSIMFDSASRDKRHVFSASLRYLNGKEIIERTLGMVTLHEQHRSELLKNELTSLLERVGLNLNEIYSTCTDQGANMLKAADLIIEAQTSLRIAKDLEEQEIQSDDETDDELFNPDRVAQDHSVDSAVCVLNFKKILHWKLLKMDKKIMKYMMNYLTIWVL